MLDNTSNQPSKFRTKTWVWVNDESRGAYNTNSQIEFKATMSKSSLCDYSDAYILVFTGRVVVQVLKEQLTGINIHQNQNYWDKMEI